MLLTARQSALAGLILGSCALVALDSAAQSLLQTIERDPPGDRERFGLGDVAIDGDELLLGCATDDRAGIIYRFERAGDRFVSIGTIGNTERRPGSNFGYRIRIDGDRMVVSAPGLNSNRGGGFAYAQQGGDWVATAELTAAEPRGNEFLGNGADVRGPHIALGTQNLQQFPRSGRVVIFRDDGNAWVETQVLAPNSSNGFLQDLFGNSIAFVEDDVLAVGSPGTDAVYIYRLVGDIWIEEQVLQYTGAFGWAVAASEGVLFVTDILDSEAALRAGAVYAFAHDGSAWIELDKMLASDAVAGGRLGYNISCQGDRVLVGASGEVNGESDHNGKAYVFERTGPEEWVERAIMTSPPPLEGISGNAFGLSGALAGNLAICTACNQDSEHGLEILQGAVYVFDLDRRQAPLTDFTIAFGTLESGELDWLRRSGNAAIVARSQFGFAASEPNLVDLRIGAASPLPSPASIDLSIEGRLSQNGGTCRVRLRNWSTNGFQQVHQYPIGNTETIEDILGIDATNRVRAADGRIELSLRQSVMATFSATGFQSFNDWIGVAVRD